MDPRILRRGLASLLACGLLLVSGEARAHKQSLIFSVGPAVGPASPLRIAKSGVFRISQ